MSQYKKLYIESDLHLMRVAGPAGQAAFLNENNTELNISFGLCMGHDIILNQKSKAPVTTLIVKDREHKYNSYKEFESNR